ncbi:hypothetical protein SteCoe_10372 [Stentor coeruleus]|uniref:Protein kinase domain-containing protein n=1 Tax=Stentor coeruleus TaxID=5963 RepID=A0A1R2CFL5_9CILI|nr:hypothetical protein SteCoe_10372 [Stentor coeruleus]
MGCCQTSTLSTNEQVCLYSHNEIISCQESIFDSVNNIDLTSKPYYKISEPPTRLFASDDITSIYSLGNRICPIFYGERYFCIHNPSETVKEILILKKLEMSLKAMDRILDNTFKLQANSNDSLVKIFYIGEDDRCINIVTEPCADMNLADFIRINRIQKNLAVKLLEQIIKGVAKYHECGIVLQYLTDREVFIINGQAKIHPLVLLNASSFTRAPETEIGTKNDVWSVGLLFLQMVTSAPYIKNPQDVIDKLEALGFDIKDLDLVRKMFAPALDRCSLVEILAHRWNNDGYINCGSSPKKPGISLEELCFEKQPEEVSDSPSIADEENSDNVDASERIEKSSETSNEFYQSRELFDSHKSDNCEIADYDSGPFEWQELDLNSNGKIKIYDILLHDEMKEILESSPDHEESSMENMNNLGVSPIENNRISDENPLDQPTCEGGFFTSDKSSINFTLTESPIFNDEEIKTPDIFTFSTPILIEEESQETSQNQEETPKDYENADKEVIENLIFNIKNPHPISSLLIHEDIPTACDFTENNYLKSQNGKKSCLGSAETSDQDIDSFKGKNFQNLFIKRSSSCIYSKMLDKIYLYDEKIVKENIEGKLKDYSFRKGFGVVCDVDEEEIILYEDEIILSGVKISSIRNAVLRKCFLNLRFSVLEYYEGDACMRKAVDISIIDI